MSVKVAVLEDRAYWVHKNMFWTCPVESGKPLKSEAVPVDALNMTDVEVGFLFGILDRLEQK